MPKNQGAWIEARWGFETDGAFCSAIVSLVLGDDGEWRIWVLRTVLEQLKEVPNVDVLKEGSEREARNGNVNGYHDGKQFDCVVIGGGGAGLSLGGRLKALGVSYVVLDRNLNVGDSWKLRYRSARCESPAIKNLK